MKMMSNSDFENTPPQAAQQPAVQPSSDPVPPQSAKQDGWERDVLEKLAFATLNEQRARRQIGRAHV